jgi:hypothetical protein
MEACMYSNPGKMREQIELIAEESDIPLLFIDGHDNAIIGLARSFNTTSVLYDKKIVIKNLMEDMTEEEAEEYFEFNIVGAYVGEYTPTFMDDLPLYD